MNLGDASVVFSKWQKLQARASWELYRFAFPVPAVTAGAVRSPGASPRSIVKFGGFPL